MAGVSLKAYLQRGSEGAAWETGCETERERAREREREGERERGREAEEGGESYLPGPGVGACHLTPHNPLQRVLHEARLGPLLRQHLRERRSASGKKREGRA